jgi:hypothetical protein
MRVRVCVAAANLVAVSKTVLAARDSVLPFNGAAEFLNTGVELAITVRRDSAVKLIDGLAGESPASAGCPVGTGVISGDGAGDQTVGSPDVNVLVGRRQVWSAPTGGLAKQQVVAQANRSQASKTHPHKNRSVRIKGTPKLFYPKLKARVFGEVLGQSIRRVPRGLRGRHVVKEHE